LIALFTGAPIKAVLEKYSTPQEDAGFQAATTVHVPAYEMRRRLIADMWIEHGSFFQWLKGMFQNPGDYWEHAGYWALRVQDIQDEVSEQDMTLHEATKILADFKQQLGDARHQLERIKRMSETNDAPVIAECGTLPKQTVQREVQHPRGRSGRRFP
jgi:hypothetical protein